MVHDIKSLKDKTDRLDKSISGLGKLGAKLSGIIHKPGWTTIAEFALVEASLDSLHRQIETATDHYTRLIEAAGRVGESK